MEYSSFIFHRFYLIKMRKRIYILFVLLLHIQSNVLYAQENIDNKISLIYHNLSDRNQFTETDYNFLHCIKESDLSHSQDSVIYQYHYLIGSWLDLNDGDLQQRIYHIDKALHLLETSSQINPIGIFDIEYLWLSNAMAECFKEKGDIDKAIFQYERILVRGEYILTKASSKNYREAKSRTLCSLGELYAKKGYKREAISCFEKAFEISKEYYELEATESYFPLWLLGNYYMKEKDYSNSIQIYKQLSSFLKQHNGNFTTENAESYYFLGNAYGKLNNLDSAIICYKQSIEIFKRIDANFSDMAPTYSNLWCVYAQSGNVEKFKEIKDLFYNYYASQNLDYYYRDLWAASTLLPSDKIDAFTEELLREFTRLDLPKQVNLLCRLANENLKDNPQNTIQYSERCLNIIKQSGVKDASPGWYFKLYQVRSLAYEERNELNFAINDAKIALGYFTQCDDIKDSITQQLLLRIGNLYLKNKEYDKVIETGNALLTITLQLYGAQSAEYISCMNLFGIGLMYTGECHKSINLFKKSVKLIEEKYGTSNIMLASVMNNIGRAYMIQGDKQNAVIYLEKAKDLQLEIEGTINTKTLLSKEIFP